MNNTELKKLMAHKNMSIYRLSKMTDIDDRSLGKIVNGKTTNPKIETLFKIAKALELSNDEFLKLCGYNNEK